MTLPITVGDIDAMCDVLARLTEQSDELTAEQAVLLDKALGRVAGAVREATALVRAQAVKALDGQPIQVGGTLYVATAKGKTRPDHDAIKAGVAHWSRFDHDTGEALKGVKAVPRAVAAAIHACYELFVAESSTPKQGGLKLIGMNPKDATRWERTGSEIKEVVVDGGHD